MANIRGSQGRAEDLLYRVPQSEAIQSLMGRLSGIGGPSPLDDMGVSPIHNSGLSSLHGQLEDRTRRRRREEPDPELLEALSRLSGQFNG